ncbi:MAG: hypothetical protein WBX00_32850 [Isosphaeraceae bacterium]
MGGDAHLNGRQCDGDTNGGNYHEKTDAAVHAGGGGVLGLMAGATAPARADLTTFTAAGTFDAGAMLGGHLTIDTALGTVTAVDLTVSAPVSQTFDLILQQTANSPIAGSYNVVIDSTALPLGK